MRLMKLPKYIGCGCFDILVKMSGSSAKELENTYSKIKYIDGIKNASTLIGFGERSSHN
jgi:hypothetical protein